MMVQRGPFKFFARVTDPMLNSYYLCGTASNSTEFKNMVRNWFAENVDPTDAYNLKFSSVSNVGTIDGKEESQFTQI